MTLPGFFTEAANRLYVFPNSLLKDTVTIYAEYLASQIFCDKKEIAIGGILIWCYSGSVVLGAK